MCKTHKFYKAGLHYPLSLILSITWQAITCVLFLFLFWDAWFCIPWAFLTHLGWINLLPGSSCFQYYPLVDFIFSSTAIFTFKTNKSAKHVDWPCVPSMWMTEKKRIYMGFWPAIAIRGEFKASLSYRAKPCLLSFLYKKRKKWEKERKRKGQMIDR